MANKVIIGLLVFLVVLSCGLGAYSYLLSQQLHALNEQFLDFQTEQTGQIGAVSDELKNFRGETMAEIGSLESDIIGTLARVGVLEDEVGGFSKSLMNANEVYQRVSQAVVRVTDGERSIGSGFVFDDKAHVVTAYHVVEQLSDIYVILPDGSISTATVAGSCQFSDIAVLTLGDELSVEPLSLADSAAVRIGEPVVTIGSPFNLTETLTSGVVSQVDRFVEIETDSQNRWVANLIQFDAAANFGNSGGPLLNSAGEVLGMIIARVNPERGDGIYYAVSSNKIRRVASAIIDQGFFDYPWVGVGIANLTLETVYARGLETINGALVKEVVSGGPAAAAGLQVDDIIIAIDGAEVGDVARLTSYMGEHLTPGEPANFTVIRGTALVDISLEVGLRQ